MNFGEKLQCLIHVTQFMRDSKDMYAGELKDDISKFIAKEIYKIINNEERNHE